MRILVTLLFFQVILIFCVLLSSRKRGLWSLRTFQGCTSSCTGVDRCLRPVDKTRVISLVCLVPVSLVFVKEQGILFWTNDETKLQFTECKQHSILTLNSEHNYFLSPHALMLKADISRSWPGTLDTLRIKGHSFSTTMTAYFAINLA